jgi:hypothetical protein
MVDNECDHKSGARTQAAGHDPGSSRAVLPGKAAPTPGLGFGFGLGLAACAALAGCVVGEPPKPEVAARTLFDTQAWPALSRCGGCHASQPSIDFMAPGTPEGAYTAMFDYQPPVLDMESPSSSLLLGMGKHTGPELLPTEVDAILAWLEAEREERVVAPPDPVVVGPLTLQLGTMNQVALPAEGALLRFVPADTGSGTLSLTELVLQAGPRGLRAIHPLFATKPAAGHPILDTADRYRDVDLELAPNAAERLGGGAALFTTFPSTDPLVIHFRKLEAP